MNTISSFPSNYEKFAFLSSTSSIGLVITDMDGVIISFNKAIHDLFGIDFDEYKNTNIIELYANPDERHHLLSLLAESNSVRNFEVEVKHKNGTLRSVLANIDSIEMNNEHFLLTSLYDITQYKQRQKNQDESDKSYQNLFSNVPVGITVTDFGGNLILSNNAILELMGYSAKEIKGKSINDFYSNLADRQRLLELTTKLGYVRDFETTFKHKNGNTVTVLLNTDVIEFNNQENRLLTSIRDISNLKHIEDELKKERDFSNIILNIAATLIVVIDHKGIITRFNRACEQISGYSFDEIIGTYLWDTNFFEPTLT